MFFLFLGMFVGKVIQEAWLIVLYQLDFEFMIINSAAYHFDCSGWR